MMKVSSQAAIVMEGKLVSFKRNSVTSRIERANLVR